MTNPEFNKGSELDKQIYKEGSPSWGLKEGFLDVEDVKLCFKEIKDEINLRLGEDKNNSNYEDGMWGDNTDDFFELIDKKIGEKLSQSSPLTKEKKK